eukprot:CAMPEP_0179041506 /NCGR_PEP_ID=MMETSP0796-20121207/16191_1 /TAXON_ID=73915 /ORGANISM="Pyrodinium bahamense, Strain pbaha01" /LENGTH=416 /DNA_ID=CAMNT_0020737871 /DNA_START=122 /DNA_END=1372 /DNA_ORIENTATION=+
MSLVQPMTCERQLISGAAPFHPQYILKGKLGKGAFAQVHLAKTVAHGNEVAVKITDLRGSHRKHERDEVDQRTKRSVEKEVAILRRVGAQPFCVGFYEGFIEGLLSYVVMERCDMTLLQALERSPELTENTLGCIIKEMLQALHNIHKLAVVHRDIKPDNFLCTGPEHTVKLCDFGLAEVLPGGNGELKGVYGTAPFMSPEMLASQGYGPTTDVWSTGVIAYVLLFGQFPYQPVETTAKAMKVAILAGTPEPTFKPKASLDTGGSRVTPAALAFLHETLNRNKGQRPSAAAALQLEWMTSGVNMQQWSAPSLRPMLYAAKRAGAFDTRVVNDMEQGTMDIMLASLQAKHHGLPPQLAAHGAGHEPKKHSHSSRRNDKTHSECSLAHSSHASHISTATGSSTSYQSKHSRSAVSREP